MIQNSSFNNRNFENVVSSKSGHWKTKGALLFLGAVLLYCVCKWRKLFKLYKGGETMRVKVRSV